MFEHKRNFLDREEVSRAVRAAGQDPDRLKHLGAMIRTEVRRSMRFTKRKAAPPGQAPRWRRPEPNLRSITYHWDYGLRMMVVGAPTFPRTSSSVPVPELHEFGGLVTQPVRVRVFRGPRTKSGRKPTRRQLAALKRMSKSPTAKLLRNAALLKMPVKRVVKKYPARPYMWPAMLRLFNRLPQIWKSGIKFHTTQRPYQQTQLSFPGAAMSFPAQAAGGSP